MPNYFSVRTSRRLFALVKMDGSEMLQGREKLRAGQSGLGFVRPIRDRKLERILQSRRSGARYS